MSRIRHRHKPKSHSAETEHKVHRAKGGAAGCIYGEGAAAKGRGDRRARGGRLSAAERRAMPSSDFAFPHGGEGPKGRGAGAMPIDTVGRARNALATAHGAHGASKLSGAKLHTLEAKVHRKYPGIAIGGKKRHKD